MGNIDIPKTIEAGASSTRAGVLLLILILAFLAWRLFSRSEDRIKIVVFGTIAVATLLVISWVLLPGTPKTADVTTDNSVAVTPSERGTTHAELPSPSPQSPAAGKRAGLATLDKSEATASNGNAQKTQLSVPADVSGTWRSGDLTAIFRQEAQRIRFDLILNNANIGNGSGSIDGSALSYDFERSDVPDNGHCNATLDTGTETIKGICKSRFGPWPYVLVRAR